jgi:hypothetical protein
VTLLINIHVFTTSYNVARPSTMAPPTGQRARRTAASAARDAISNAARLQSAAILEQEQEDNVVQGRRRGLSKRVSYAEIPIDVDDLEGAQGGSSEREDDAEMGEGAEDVVMDDVRELVDDGGDALETGMLLQLCCKAKILIRSGQRACRRRKPSLLQAEAECGHAERVVQRAKAAVVRRDGQQVIRYSGRFRIRSRMRMTKTTMM